MRISLIAVGRLKPGPERELAERYFSRARATGKRLGLSEFDIHELTESRQSAAGARKSEEARTIAGLIPANAAVIALDETGVTRSSDQFASHISRLNDTGTKHLCFVIGGPDGLDPVIRQRADLVLSFSPLTWPHQIVRILLGEQLYRATTILSGHPYHRA